MKEPVLPNSFLQAVSNVVWAMAVLKHYDAAVLDAAVDWLVPSSHDPAASRRKSGVKTQVHMWTEGSDIDGVWRHNTMNPSIPLGPDVSPPSFHATHVLRCP